MKFVVAVVMLALAASVQSSLIAQIAPGVSHVTSAALHPAGLWGGLGPWGGVGVHGPAAVAVHASAPWGLTGPAGWGVPGISLSQGLGHAGGPLAWGHGLGHVAAPLALDHGIGHGGVYVAKTRGAVHTAPLAGHINSATSINVAPAPGTH